LRPESTGQGASPSLIPEIGPSGTPWTHDDDVGPLCRARRSQPRALAGFKNSKIFGRYSRADAIRDGVLIDVSAISTASSRGRTETSLV